VEIKPGCVGVPEKLLQSRTRLCNSAANVAQHLEYKQVQHLEKNFWLGTNAAHLVALVLFLPCSTKEQASLKPKNT